MARFGALHVHPSHIALGLLSAAALLATALQAAPVPQSYESRPVSVADLAETPGLPSGRTSYRQLADYSADMKGLAAANPSLVRYFTLPSPTYERRLVEGIEVTENVHARDGKPVFLMLGLHHAREWPAGEHTMEWAFELVTRYRAADPRVQRLMRTTRTIVVPVVNPDGFHTSRLAAGTVDGRGGDDLVNILTTTPGEYRRKNCRFVDDSDGGNCLQPSVGLAEPGVDPNRNYGGFWGGPGASTLQLAQDYRGRGPFSEPETQNIRHLISARQVTTLITNHTASNVIIRPPNFAGQPNPPDATIYTSLSDAMAAENGYQSLTGHEFGDVSGTTEDWTYWTGGALSYTFEIGPTNFHPPFQDVVNEYVGATDPAQAVAGGGNREAYFHAMENTADATKHAVLTGRAPAGSVLRLKKTFMTSTSPVVQPDGSVGKPLEFPDTLETTMVVPSTRRFEWHVNPSTRPIAAVSFGRDAHGEPSPPAHFQGGPSDSASPCADFDTKDQNCWNDHPFTVPAGPGIDNAKATVRIQWSTVASDWDMKLFRDTDGDGTSVGEEARGERPITIAGQPLTDSETATIVEPTLQPGAHYVARVINFAATEPYQGTVIFQGPDPFQPGQIESWTLTCERPEGQVLETRQVTIARGESQTLRLSCNRA